MGGLSGFWVVVPPVLPRPVRVAVSRAWRRTGRSFPSAASLVLGGELPVPSVLGVLLSWVPGAIVGAWVDGVGASVAVVRGRVGGG